MKIGCDFDGTLVNYGYVAGEPVKVNEVLLDTLQGNEITIITNQGGLPFGIMNRNRNDGRKYPLPEHFFQRFQEYVEITAYRNVWVKGLLISLYHPKASPAYILEVRDRLYDLFMDSDPIFDFRIFIEEGFRKPNPKMLLDAGIDVYYGDSDEDEAAALLARCEFVKVERFI